MTLTTNSQRVSPSSRRSGITQGTSHSTRAPSHGPISPHAVSKLAAESYARSFFEVYGLETVALRYFNVFGPRQDPQSEYAAVVPKFIWSFRTAEPPVSVAAAPYLRQAAALPYQSRAPPFS